MEIVIKEKISLKWQDYWELTKILLKGEWLRVRRIPWTYPTLVANFIYYCTVLYWLFHSEGKWIMLIPLLLQILYIGILLRWVILIRIKFQKSFQKLLNKEKEITMTFKDEKIFYMHGNQEKKLFLSTMRSK